MLHEDRSLPAQSYPRYISIAWCYHCNNTRVMSFLISPWSSFCWGTLTKLFPVCSSRSLNQDLKWYSLLVQTQNQLLFLDHFNHRSSHIQFLLCAVHPSTIMFVMKVILWIRAACVCSIAVIWVSRLGISVCVCVGWLDALERTSLIDRHGSCVCYFLMILNLNLKNKLCSLLHYITFPDIDLDFRDRR